MTAGPVYEATNLATEEEDMNIGELQTPQPGRNVNNQTSQSVDFDHLFPHKNHDYSGHIPKVKEAERDILLDMDNQILLRDVDLELNEMKKEHMPGYMGGSRKQESKLVEEKRGQRIALIRRKHNRTLTSVTKNEGQGFNQYI